LEFNEYWEVIVRPFASNKTADTKRIESQYKAITIIKLLTQDGEFKYYFNKAVSLLYFT